MIAVTAENTYKYNKEKEVGFSMPFSLTPHVCTALHSIKSLKQNTQYHKPRSTVLLKPNHHLICYNYMGTCHVKFF